LDSRRFFMLLLSLLAVGLSEPAKPSIHPRPACRSCISMAERLTKDAQVKALLAELDEETERVAAIKRERMAAEEAFERDAQAVNLGRVSKFGARLDGDIASEDLATARGAKKAKEEHEILFDEGITLMRRGQYKLSVSAFTRATAAAPGGLTGRKGGQYAVYLAQALQAAGRKKEAAGLLQKCESHPDKDVRKVAESVLYIMQAPELKLDESSFMKMDLSGVGADDWARSQRPQEDKDPPPEKYSIEWYMLEAEKRPVAAKMEESPVPALLGLGAALLATLAVLVFKGTSS